MDQSKQEQLPKLVKDKIDNYQRINEINSMADEMFEKVIKFADKFDSEILQVSGGHYHMLLCNHFDITTEGIKKYCMNADVSRFYTRQEIYHCELCLDFKKSYCRQHVKGKLFKLKNDPQNLSRYEIICKECLDSCDSSEEDDTPQIIEEI
ncbi:MAG: hypothetical protein WD512_14920 [Candidatus Paceibacterota bacterium]